MKTNILLTGGSGLLGQELQKYIDCDTPSRDELDITNITADHLGQYGQPNTIIHCAGYTDVVRAETDRVNCFKNNVFGTLELIQRLAPNRFIYISSEYAKKPTNFYSLTKRWSEGIVTRNINNHLIIRTSFVSSPFPHDYAFIDQYTQGDYVEMIAPMIAAAILHKRQGTKYIGTGRKTMFELARRTKPEIKGNSVDDIKEVKLQKDYE